MLFSIEICYDYTEAQLSSIYVLISLQELLGDDGVLLCPTFPGSGVATYHRESYFKPFNFIYHAVFSAVGFPSTVVPIGLSKANEPGLPMSIQV